MTHFLGIISGKGGVGKTTTAINLATALTYFGRDVVLVDGDIKHPNIGLHLGALATEKSFQHALNGTCNIKDAAYVHPSGIKIIPSALTFERPFDLKMLDEVFLDLERTCEMVIVDMPSSSAETCEFLKVLDTVLLVVEPTMPAVADALKVGTLAKDMGVKIAGAVVNKHVGDGYDVSLENVQSMLGVKVLGRVPFSQEIRESLQKKSAVLYTHPESVPSQEFKRLAQQLLGR